MMTQNFTSHPSTLVIISLLLLSSLCVANMTEQVNFQYSMKNIPIPPKQEYMLELIHSVREFIIKIKWRSHFFLNPQETPAQKETFGFKSSNAPPTIPELKTLEDKLYNLIKEIEFRDHKNPFQNRLKHDVEKIKCEENVLIKADKTTNYYKMKKNEYIEHMNRNITKDYKKANHDDFENVTKEDKKLASKLDIDDRVYKTSKREAFITLKDHKPNFKNNPKFRLLNPTKQELGKVSKQKLEKIVTFVKEKSGLKLWKDTESVITWFDSLPNKKELKFIQFDICEFYPSITKELIEKAIRFAEKYVPISEDDKELFLQTKKSFLINNDQPWKKKENLSCDVTMGSYDGAETCELVDLYLLSLCTKLIPDLGLYRDDGLAVTRSTARQREKLKQELIKVFAGEGLRITTEANIHSVNFLIEHQSLYMKLRISS